MVRGLEPAHAVIACIVLAGCDGVFGLQRIPEQPDGPKDQLQDAPGSVCPPAGGALVTKLFGGREGAVLASGVADTFLSSDAAHTSSNFGALDRLFACRQCSCTMDCDSIAGGDDDVVSLLRFDLGGQIPACSAVQSARLYLHTTGDNLGTGSVAVFAMLEAWDEGTGALPGGVTGAASWRERKPGTLWITPGAGTGSRATMALTSFTPTGTDSDYPVQIDPIVVQAWVDDGAKNHGFVFAVQGSMSDVHFHSSEAALPTKRPALEVTYRLP
jgi:hypothetical protein